MLLLIDNYDSFTWNLVHYVGELGVQAKVIRNDDMTAAAAMALNPSAVLLSPGPCDPDRAGICLDMVAACADAALPLFGVCLGHQTIGQAFGGRVIRCHEVLHGKTSVIGHENKGVFAGLPQAFTATRYHSLVVERETLPDALEITADTSSGVIMGLQHRTLPIHGVQFHPESIATEHGHRLVGNFLVAAGLMDPAALPPAWGVPTGPAQARMEALA
ncbi:anthranilate synthase, component II [Albimonas donghaensis]|uniref:Anthranilate synthase, component II n=1 Tax=Albimonas donghaensis TaxID=356660 RepID=A0A1H2RZB0_9RHOB|nr:aminodeoxychorismate/anthranilate synthase component II [Albimonas donghaensis]SDW24638.1 anthranilate synthase, component II [Albimonas donghaensis]